MQKWKAEEVEILKEIYKQGDLSLLKEYLPNRTYGSCITKARKMGLKVRELWSDEELNILKNNTKPRGNYAKYAKKIRKIRFFSMSNCRC